MSLGEDEVLMFLPLSLRIFLVVFGFFAVILDDLQRAHSTLR